MKYWDADVYKCHCMQFVSVLATVAAMMSSAGVRVTVWYKWTRRKMQKLKEKVIVTIVYASLGEIAAKSISQLKNEGCDKVTISSEEGSRLGESSTC